MAENKDLFINGLISLISEKTQLTPEIVKPLPEPNFTENHALILKEKKLAKLPVTETAIATMREALDKMPFFRDNPHASKIFSFPVLPVMFSLIPLFTGKPPKSPRGLQKILNKPEAERSESEKEMIKDTIYERLFVSEELERTSQGMRKRKSFSMFICDSPIVQATAELDPGFNAEEETLSAYIGRVFGPEE